MRTSGLSSYMAWEQVDWKKLRGVSKPKLAGAGFLRLPGSRRGCCGWRVPHSGETSEVSVREFLDGERGISSSSTRAMTGADELGMDDAIMPGRAWEAVMAKQILLVDDDRNSVKFLSAVLSDNGYDPILAYNGSEGLAKVKQSTPGPDRPWMS